nr:testis-specific Y-encoded protein 3-like isoform X2 [Pan troglodytes]
MRPEGLPAHRLQLFDLKQMANHPLISALISDQDEDMLSYVINLEVKEVKHPIHLCKIMLLFWSNPYLQNKMVTKEYLGNVTDPM